jgi:transketolase
LASLRAVPNLYVLRPSDANETAAAWRFAMERRGGPTALILSRQDLPVLDRDPSAPASECARGAYILSEAKGGRPQAIVIATGSEVSVAVEAQDLLEKEGLSVRVVSMPSWEAFEAQEAAYRESVLPASVGARVAVEAGVTLGWKRWVGDAGIVLGIDRFGASAPGKTNMEKFGFTPGRVVEAVRAAVEREERESPEPRERDREHRSKA